MTIPTAHTPPTPRPETLARGFVWPDAAAMALVAVCVLALYLPSMDFGFQDRDESIHLYENPYMENPGWDSVIRFWSAPYQKLYIPLTYTIWTGIAALARDHDIPHYSKQSLDPAPFHLANVCTHLANVLLLFLLLRALAMAPWPACAGALLFALHPLQAESVAWISEFRGLTAGCFSLLALLAHARAAKAPGHAVPLRVAALLAFVLALLCKPSAVAVPALALCLDWLALGRNPAKAVLSVLPWLAAALPVVLLTKGQQPATDIPCTAALWQRIVVAADSLSFYLARTVWPDPLAMDYGRTPCLALAQWTRYLPWAGAALAAWCVAVWRTRPAIRAQIVLSALLFFLALAPTSGLATFVFQAESTVADRYAYFALIGPALGLAMMLNRARTLHSGTGRAAALGAACLLGVFFTVSRPAVMAWGDMETLCLRTLKVNPGSGFATNALAGIAFAKGDYPRAEKLLRKALRLEPDNAWLIINLGETLYREQRLAEALPLFLRGAQLEPSHYRGNRYAGELLIWAGKPDKALPYLRHAETLQPGLPDHLVPLAIALDETDKKQEAMAILNQLLVHYPGDEKTLRAIDLLQK